MTVHRATWEILPEPRTRACFAHAGIALRRGLPALAPLAVLVALAELATARLALGPLGAVAALAFAAFACAPLHDGFAYVCLRAARGVPAAPRHALRVLDNYREAVAATAIVWLVTALGLALFVVPGVVFWCRTRFVPYLVVEEGLDAVDAIHESLRLTRGHGAAIVGIGLVGGALAGIGLACFGIGVVPAIAVWQLAQASLYHAAVLPSESFEPERRFARPFASA